MKILVNCPKGCDTAINVDINGSYAGPEISCAKCNTTMLVGVIQTFGFGPTFAMGGPGLSGAATIPLQTGQMNFIWPSYEVVDAEHAETCQCIECKPEAV
jgi:hypothetical protein